MEYESMRFVSISGYVMGEFWTIDYAYLKHSRCLKYCLNCKFNLSKLVLVADEIKVYLFYTLIKLEKHNYFVLFADSHKYIISR